MRYRNAGMGNTQTSCSVVCSRLSSLTPIVLHCLASVASEMRHLVSSTMQFAVVTE